MSDSITFADILKSRIVQSMMLAASVYYVSQVAIEVNNVQLVTLGIITMIVYTTVGGDY